MFPVVSGGHPGDLSEAPPEAGFIREPQRITDNSQGEIGGDQLLPHLVQFDQPHQRSTPVAALPQNPPLK